MLTFIYRLKQNFNITKFTIHSTKVKHTVNTFRVKKMKAEI